MNGSRDQATSADEGVVPRGIVYGYDGRMAHQASEVGTVPRFFAGHWNEAGGRCLVVDDADGHFIGNDCGNGF